MYVVKLEVIMKNDFSLLNYRFFIKFKKNKKNLYPELIVNCIIPFNLYDANVQLKMNYLHIEKQVLDWIRDFDGIYFGEIFDGGYGNLDGFHKIEYHFKVVGDTGLALSLAKHFKQLKIKQNERLEVIMGTTTKAPYKLWSIKTLKDECKRRKFKIAIYKDVDDKKKLIAILVDADKTATKETPAKKTSVKKTSAKKTATKKTPPAEDEAELDELDEAEDEAELDELDEAEAEDEAELDELDEDEDELDELEDRKSVV